MQLLDVQAAPRFGTDPVAWCAGTPGGELMPRLEGTTQEKLDEAMLTIARHVPTDVEIGRPLMAWGREIGEHGDVAVFTDLALATLWFPEKHRVCRLVELSGGRTHELTEYADGHEVSRKIGPAE